MSNTKKKQKIVRITESNLVEMIDEIVAEAVKVKKKEWIAENASKNDDAEILEERIKSLEAKINKLTESK